MKFRFNAVIMEESYRNVNGRIKWIQQIICFIMHLKPGTCRLVFIGKWAVIDIGEEKREGIDARVIK